jgi:hypothetical protein
VNPGDHGPSGPSPLPGVGPAAAAPSGPPSLEHDRRPTGPLPAERRLPRTDRLDVDHPAYVPIVSRHEEALDAGRDTYHDPLTGFQVFTAAALWDRGECCGTGCRHCPYGVVERADCCATGCAGCPVTEAYAVRRRTGCTPAQPWPGTW